MENFRKYGEPPFHLVVLHGGPGAAGEMAPVAKELSKTTGVLEALQTKKSIAGQLEELKKVVEKNGKLPITLVGWSWGAWLGYLFTVRHPSLVEKLIIVSSGPFEQKYVKKMEAVRMGRFTNKEKVQLEVFNKAFKNPKLKNKNSIFAQFGKLFNRIESYNPVSIKTERNDIRLDIYQGVWPKAAKLRQTGKLLKLGKKINCPVIAIHGDYDTHPAEGVKKPLSKVIKDFKFILLKNCGHKPWIERNARGKFYKILRLYA